MLNRNAMKRIQSLVILGLMTVSTLVPSSILLGQERQPTGNAYSSTKDGITVQLEKVAVSRILNSQAFLKSKEVQTSQGNQIPDGLKEHLPARLVTFSVSVIGETTQLGVSKIGFTNGKRTIASASRFYSPPKWQRRLPNLVLAPKANGIESQLLLRGDTKISDLFPTQIEVQVTTKRGKILKFAFDGVTF